MNTCEPEYSIHSMNQRALVRQILPGLARAPSNGLRQILGDLWPPVKFPIQAGWILLFCKRLVCLPPVDRAAARTRRTGQCRATERAFHGGCHATSMRLRDRLKAPIPVSCLVRMDAALRVTPLKVAERRPKLAQDKSHLAGVWQEPPGIGQVGREAVDAVRLGCREARVP